MSVHTDLMVSAGLPALIAQQGESVTCRPDGTTTRAVTAIVERSPPAALDGVDQAVAPRITVIMANNASTGMTAAEIITGVTTVDVATRAGGTVETRYVLSIRHDAAVVMLEMR